MMGEIITFYSYKGGVGRTMALANVAALLSKWGYKVLLIDWDLEAPGLEFYFKEFLNLKAVAQQKGIIDLLVDTFDNPSQPQTSFTWQELLLKIELPVSQKPLHFLTAGERSENYFSKVRNLDLQTYYVEKNGGMFIESLRNEWKEAYDYVLVDSRTGITDNGGICTIQLPDMLVLLLTATDQSLQGIIDVAKKANRARKELPFDRFSLLSIPIPSRFDSTEEFKISQEWLNRFSKELKELYANWLPDSLNRRTFLEITKISYQSYFSFGEKLPVLEHGTVDPAGLGYAYETLASLIANQLESAEQLLENRGEYVKSASLKTEIVSKPSTLSLTHIPGYRYDIFVSYAYIDNKPAHKVKEGWVTTFMQGLKTELARRLGQENFSLQIEHELAGNVPISPEIMQNLQNSAALIVVLSQGYLASTWCQQEQGDFLRVVQERCRADSRVFVIELDESERPPEFGNLRGYRFFKQFRGKRHSQILGWPEPRPEDHEYYNMIVELSYDLADELRRLRNISREFDEETFSINSATPHATVFLAEVTGDLYHVREEVQRYLLQNEFHVLPKIKYSLDKSYKTAVSGDLAKSDLFVQLLSDVPDKKSPEIPQGYVRCQYELAREMGKSILQWRSPKLPIDDVQNVEHRDLLQSYTVFAVGLEEFKAEIIQKAGIQKKTSITGDNLGRMVFLVANPHEDAILVNTISELFTQFQIGYFLPLQSELPSENQKAFEEHILNSDAVMIVYGKVSVYWVNNQLIQIRKILLAHTHNIQTFAVFIGPPEEKPPLPFNFPGLQIIERRNHLDRQKLIEFIKSIQRRETP